jgi:ubiquinone/menaquinone biosynthesis C-methylase UbiE
MQDGTEKFKEMVKEGYNRIANTYLEARNTDSGDVALLYEFMDLLEPDTKVLDAGCGAGVPITQILVARNYDVVGVDFSTTQIELAKQNLPTAEFLCEDLTKLSLPDNTFGGIVSYYAIIHIPREEHCQILQKFYTLLKAQGVALLCLGCEHLIDDIAEDFLGARMYWSHYDTKTYNEMLTTIGFTILWAKHVGDESCGGSGHLFVLVAK